MIYVGRKDFLNIATLSLGTIRDVDMLSILWRMAGVWFLYVAGGALPNNAMSPSNCSHTTIASLVLVRLFRNKSSPAPQNVSLPSQIPFPLLHPSRTKCAYVNLLLHLTTPLRFLKHYPRALSRYRKDIYPFTIHRLRTAPSSCLPSWTKI